MFSRNSEIIGAIISDQPRISYWIFQPLLCSFCMVIYYDSKRYQNDCGRFRVHCCVVCNLDHKLSLLRGMTDDHHTLTYFLFFINSLFLPFFDFDLDIVCFILFSFSG